MKPIDIIVICIVALIVLCAIAYIIMEKKRGGGCGCGCNGCPHAGACHSNAAQKTACGETEDLVNAEFPNQESDESTGAELL